MDEVLEEAKLICGDKNQNSACTGEQGGTRTGHLRGDGNVLLSMELVATRVSTFFKMQIEDFKCVHFILCKLYLI